MLVVSSNTELFIPYNMLVVILLGHISGVGWGGGGYHRQIGNVQFYHDKSEYGNIIKMFQKRYKELGVIS